jgi:hypothetical protein
MPVECLFLFCHSVFKNELHLRPKGRFRQGDLSAPCQRLATPVCPRIPEDRRTVVLGLRGGQQGARSLPDALQPRRAHKSPCSAAAPAGQE